MFIYRNKGMILISVLIFLQVATFFILYGLRLAAIETKQSRLDLQKFSAISIMPWVLKKVEQQIRDNPSNCHIPVTPIKTLLTQPLDWWQSFATCGGNFDNLTYFFVVEDLGKDVCAIIPSHAHKVANFFRITVLGLVSDIKIKMQGVIILPIDEDINACKDKPHQVLSIKQYWHEIS